MISSERLTFFAILRLFNITSSWWQKPHSSSQVTDKRWFHYNCSSVTWPNAKIWHKVKILIKQMIPSKVWWKSNYSLLHVVSSDFLFLSLALEPIITWIMGNGAPIMMITWLGKYTAQNKQAYQCDDCLNSREGSFKSTQSFYWKKIFTAHPKVTIS